MELIKILLNHIKMINLFRNKITDSSQEKGLNVVFKSKDLKGLEFNIAKSLFYFTFFYSLKLVV